MIASAGDSRGPAMKNTPRIPAHRTIAHPERVGELGIETHVIGGHTIWVAVDELGVVALAGSEEELRRALADSAG
jgi:hypothetical protein